MGYRAWAALVVLAGASASCQLGCHPGGVPATALASPSPPSTSVEPPTVHVEHAGAPPFKTQFDDLFDEAAGDPAVQAVLERSQQIDAELRALDRVKLSDKDWAKEWAGEYYTGDGLGMNATIKIAPRSGLSFTWYGCMGLYEKNYGPITKSDTEGIEVDLKLATGSGTMGYMSSKLYFVRWGDRRYLVPESRMLTLVNNYNEGGYGRSGMFSIPRKREEGEPWHRFESAPAGRPRLPAAYAAMLRDTPLRLTVTAVAVEPDSPEAVESGGSRSTIEFRGGADVGAYIGLKFWAGPAGSRGVVEIVSLQADSCTGVLTVYGDKGSFTPPKVGDVMGLGEDVGAKAEPTESPVPEK